MEKLVRFPTVTGICIVAVGVRAIMRGGGVLAIHLESLRRYLLICRNATLMIAGHHKSLGAGVPLIINAGEELATR